jgi:hypothetical protein
LALYEISVHKKSITCVDYHPNDHSLAFAVYGAPVPVKILKYDREADGKSVGLKLLVTASDIAPVNSITKPSNEPVALKNGGKNLDLLPMRSRSSSVNISRYSSTSHLLTRYKDSEEVAVHVKGKMEKIIGNGPNLRSKSMYRLNGIIEKIDRILMYATTQKSPAVDLESARDSSIFTVTEREPRKTIESFELKELTQQKQKNRSDRTSKKHRHRSKSARNSCSSIIQKEIESSKALSDSAAFNRKVSRFSDDSSNSTRSVVHKKFAIERLELDCLDTESGFKDSLDTIVDGKEDFTSEEILDVESLKSDDTYVVSKDNSPESGDNDNELSDGSNATFVIESEIPIPKPRKKIGKIEVM